MAPEREYSMKAKIKTWMWRRKIRRAEKLMEDEEIVDPSTFWNQLKTSIYWIVRIPGMFFDPRRRD